VDVRSYSRYSLTRSTETDTDNSGNALVRMLLAAFSCSLLA